MKELVRCLCGANNFYSDEEDAEDYCWSCGSQLAGPESEQEEYLCALAESDVWFDPETGVAVAGRNI